MILKIELSRSYQFDESMSNFRDNGYYYITFNHISAIRENPDQMQGCGLEFTRYTLSLDTMSIRAPNYIEHTTLIPITNKATDKSMAH